MYILTVECEWNSWGDWVGCTKTCGGGVKSRTRNQKTVSVNGEALCDEKMIQRLLCDKDACPGLKLLIIVTDKVIK